MSQVGFSFAFSQEVLIELSVFRFLERICDARSWFSRTKNKMSKGNILTYVNPRRGAQGGDRGGGVDGGGRGEHAAGRKGRGGLALDKHESLKWYLNASFASAFSSPCVLAHQRWRDLPYLDVSQRRRMSTRCQRSPPSLQVRAPTVSEGDRCFGPHGPAPLWRWWARSPSPYRCRIRTPACAQRNFGAWTG